jgi:hypothetical protein
MSFTSFPLGDLYPGKTVTLIATLEFDPSVIDHVSVQLRGAHGGPADVDETITEKVTASQLRLEFRGVVAENVSLHVDHSFDEPITLKTGQLDISVHEAPWI